MVFYAFPKLYLLLLLVIALALSRCFELRSPERSETRPRLLPQAELLRISKTAMHVKVSLSFIHIAFITNFAGASEGGVGTAIFWCSSTPAARRWSGKPLRSYDVWKQCSSGRWNVPSYKCLDILSDNYHASGFALEKRRSVMVIGRRVCKTRSCC